MIVLPVAIALTIAPAVSPIASWFRGRRFLERPAAALALLMALALVTVLVAIVAVSVIEQFDELVASVRRAVDDLAAQLEREPFNLSVEETEDLQSPLEESWREASGYAALAFALAVLVFMGSFVPDVGAFVSGLVAVLVAFADGGWELALAVLGVVLLVQFVEGTFLQPLIQSRSVHLHPAVVLLAVAAGGSLFGIAGAYLAVPVTAVVAAVFGSLSSEAPEPDAAA